MKSDLRITITIPAPLRWIFTFWGVLLLVLFNSFAMVLVAHPIQGTQLSTLNKIETGLSLLGLGNSLFILYLIMASFRETNNSR